MANSSRSRTFRLIRRTISITRVTPFWLHFIWSVEWKCFDLNLHDLRVFRFNDKIFKMNDTSVSFYEKKWMQQREKNNSQYRNIIQTDNNTFEVVSTNILLKGWISNHNNNTLWFISELCIGKLNSVQLIFIIRQLQSHANQSTSFNSKVQFKSNIDDLIKRCMKVQNSWCSDAQTRINFITQLNC